ncbi:hypothetical protein HJC23_010876 [Cyclotella cryptica]|uniref:Helicase-associated domain-containing protein n=1 Tax=Cyclotella cryptica TaxID=29204 RepID=A0ABD3QP28_9STRA|eukprot:CCRYP_003638-RB/>CCRYP_003638-RB protein AED:0.19 eAED:0.19 QI:142/1/1/1/1/1/3/1746/394
MFHLLDSVPGAVSDALAAASTSSSKSIFQGIHSVSLEIDKAFHEIPPSVKDALSAVVNSVDATCEENLATLYLCFSDEFDKMKNEYECRIAEITSENKSLILRLEQHEKTNLVQTLYHNTNEFSQAGPGCHQNHNHDVRKTSRTGSSAYRWTTKFSSHRVSSPTEEELLVCAVPVNQRVAAHAVVRKYHQTRKIYDAHTDRDQKHHRDQKPSSTMVQRKEAMISFSQESLFENMSPCTAQERYNFVWNQSFHELSEYKKRFGTCDVPPTYSENPRLQIWINDQRLHYRNCLVGKTPSLTSFQIRCLESIGFQWVNTLHVCWEERFKQLVEYKHETRGTNQKPSLALGRWIVSQRNKYKAGQLTEERIKKLEGIGFVWYAQSMYTRSGNTQQSEI